MVGSGPGGLTVAGDLSKKGRAVTIFEAFYKAGRAFPGGFDLEIVSQGTLVYHPLARG